MNEDTRGRLTRDGIRIYDPSDFAGMHKAGALAARILDAITEEVAVVMLTQVDYRTGRLHDMAALTQAAHAAGAVTVLDLAHTAGAMAVDVAGCNADFAVGCTYKYLNGGPGAIGGCFVHARHADDSSLPRFCGWWGHEKSSRFRMGPNFHPIPGAEGWQLSNPPILAMTSLIPSLQLFHEAGMTELRAKSLALTGFLELGIRERLGGAVSGVL